MVLEYVVGQWSLHLLIQSIGAVRLTGAERDTLLLTFKVIEICSLERGFFCKRDSLLTFKVMQSVFV
jgi:hypothetical protein